MRVATSLENQERAANTLLGNRIAPDKSGLCQLSGSDTSTALDVNILDDFIPEAGSFYVMDRDYVDFERLYVFTLCAAFFVVRSKENILLQRRYFHRIDKSAGYVPIKRSS